MGGVRKSGFLLAAVSILSLLLCNIAAAQTTQPVTINWLDQSPPAAATGVSFGVPWTRGTFKPDQKFSLKSTDGVIYPVQTWPMAYWPDGSLKWSGFATVAGPKAVGGLLLSASDATDVIPAKSGPVVSVQQTDSAVTIDTGYLQCRIPRSGEYLIDTLSIGGKVVGSNAHLEVISQTGPELDAAMPPPRVRYVSDITKVTVEQSGPVRAVVKIEGMHKSESGSRSWLPFYVRFYFYAGNTPVRMVHSFVFDGDEQQDFIRGMAIVFSVPMREEIQNRHVRFSSQGTNLWAEPIEPLLGYNVHVRNPTTGADAYYDQIAGKRVANKKDLDARSAHFVQTVAQWDDFRLIQPNAQGFTVEKRTNPQSAWIAAGSGTRSTGLAFAGDVSGGLAVCLKNFWQLYPTTLEIDHAKSAAAELRIWLWSPEAPAMDLRHYDTVAHELNQTYEDVQPGLSTANGIARTSDLTIFPCDTLPSKQETATDAQIASQTPQLVCTPQYLHDAGAFGVWSLQDRSTPFKKSVEDQLDEELAFYEKAVDQYHWYGFWDYGDIMHSYDAARQSWRYDIGGFAWDNDEQCTEMWLWYSFLRSGRADLFRMASNMTRQISEVDCYHQGKLAGLGSRHNVRHWGDGAKEIRISQAAYRRFFYYLTTDERVGDVMREMLASEQRVAEFDPMREALPAVASDKQYPARIRAGPDWLALVGNWMTEWERTGDTKWRDKIYAGIDSIKAMPYWFKTSPSLVWGFFPDTDKLVARQNVMGGYNLVTNMGGPEVMFELDQFIDRPDWVKIWLQYCRLSTAPADVVMRDKSTGNEGANGQYAGGGRMAAYAYMMTKNPAYAARAMGGIIGGGGGRGGGGGGGRGPRWGNDVHLDGPDVLNPLDVPQGFDGIITNTINQTSLQTIEVLEMCKDQLPKTR